MAIVINNEPGSYPSVTDEMLFTVYEATKAIDEVTYPDYRYVCDIYVDSVLVARQKARPNPDNKRGIFDVSTVLRDYISSYGLKANYSNQTEVYTVQLNYRVKFGEEYDGTLYTNLLVDSSDRDCYPSYEKRPFTDSEVLLTGNPQVASNMPLITHGYKEEKWKILPLFSNTSGLSLDYRIRNASGVLIEQGSILHVGNKTINQINLGLQRIITALALTDQNVEDAATIDFDFEDGDIYTINLICSKHPLVTLAWLNPFGGYESACFMGLRRGTLQPRKLY
jgi:hypothetical protein